MLFDVPGSSEGGNRIYYTLMFVTEDGEVLKMGDRELTLQVTGTLGYAQYVAGLYKRQMQKGKPYQIAYNAKTLEEYLLTLPENKRKLEHFFNSSVAVVEFFDFNPIQRLMEIASLPKTIYLNAQIALARAIGKRKQGWVENAGYADYSREASLTYGFADTAAQLKEAGLLGNVALGYLDMVSDPMFWLGGGFGIRAGLKMRAATVPGSLEESLYMLDMGKRAAPYGILPDEAFETQTKTGTTKAGETGGVGEDIFAKALAGEAGVGNATKQFASPSKYVSETANAIESEFPGRVVGVDKKVYRPNGSTLTDYDIELDTIVIQVKSGSGKGLTAQMARTKTGTNKIIIGYAPDLNPSSALVKGAKEAGFQVFTNWDDLLEFLYKN